MPHVDLETLVSVCAATGNRKITCETLADGDNDGEKQPEEEEEKPDLPPESFWLSKDAEYDWFDRNAFYERKDSTRGNSNSPKIVNPASNSSSQRFSANLKSKAAMIGLPKTQKTSYVDTTNWRNCKRANIRLFPKRPESVGKTAEPSSPKVSCMGRVRSKRGRKKSSEPEAAPSKPEEKVRSVDRRRTGIYGRFIAIFRLRRKERPGVETYAPPPRWKESPPRRSVTVKAREFPEAAAEPPDLGGMMRFASGRRSSSVADDLT